MLRGNSLLIKDSYQRENGGKGNKRKTKTDDAGLDDGGRLWKVERIGPTTEEVMTSYIRTCLGGREPEEEKRQE